MLISHRALDVVGRLANQRGQKGASAWATLDKLMDSNLSAKYWVAGRLAPTDILTECEFFDAGLVSTSGTLAQPLLFLCQSLFSLLPQAQSTSSPFTPLSSLLSRPLSMNRPVLTVSLLAKPLPPPPPSSEDTQQLEGSHSATSVSSRTKSRAATTREGKG